MTLSEHFIELAARLRRIDHRDPRKAQQEIDSAAAWGAKLVRHASDAGHLDLTTICTDPESLWPAETGFPTAATAEAWRNLWLVFATFLCRLYPHRLPPDVCGSVFSEREPGVYDLRVHTNEWRIRAEGYALIAEFLAENSAAGEVNGPPGEPPRSADNAEPRPANTPKPKYQPPPCPCCGKKARVTSKQGSVRYLKCSECGRTWPSTK